MAWVKIPADNHPLFLAAVPKDKRVTTLKMFGGIAAKVNGQMFAGLFARSFVVKLSPEDQKTALALDGAEPFDPMGKGAIMKDTILMPEAVFDDTTELRDWLARGLAYTASLPPKQATKKPAAKKPAKKPAAKPAAKKPAAKKKPKRR
jgi:TfoX/Sxy family transcriptional regulator of competence genes